MAMETRRDMYLAELSALKAERTRHEDVWEDIARNMMPDSDPKGIATKGRDAGERRDLDIIDSKPLECVTILASGLMSGVTSPVRNWFKLAVLGEPGLSEFHTVRLHLDTIQRVISSLFHLSNWYDVLASSTYRELGTFASALLIQDEDPRLGMWFTSSPVGEFWVDVDERGNPIIIYRERRWTVRQIVRRFGLESCSKRVKDEYAKGNYQTLFAVIHRIAANDDKQPGALGARGMGYSSCWFEKDNPDKNQYLEEKGYHEFAGIYPRWLVIPETSYGVGSPGRTMLGACKALQLKNTQGAKMMDRAAEPPMLAIGNASKWSLRPGAVTELPAGTDMDFRPAITINPTAMAETRLDREEVRRMISNGFYVKLFQAMIDDERKERPTATEVEAMRQETMQMLAPLLMSMDTRLLRPVIERAYNIAKRMGLLPPPPPELAGQAVAIEFISIAHQAQKSAGIHGMRTVVGDAMAMAAVEPDVLDNIDTDVVIREYVDMAGVTPRILRDKSQVEEIRKQKAAMMQQQQQQAAQVDGSKVIKNIGTSDPQAVQDIMKQVPQALAASSGNLSPVGAGG